MSMKISISKETYEPRWKEFKGAKFLLKPFPMGRNDLILSTANSMSVTGQQRKNMFMETVKEWKDLVDDNEAAIPFSEEIKELIFDHNVGGIAGFVYEFNSEFSATLRNESENLQGGQDGTSKEGSKPAQIVETK